MDESKEILNRNSTRAVQKRKKSRTKRKKGGKVNFLHGGCLQLLVLFDSIRGLGFHKRDHFINLSNQCVHTLSMTRCQRRQLASSPNATQQ